MMEMKPQEAVKNKLILNYPSSWWGAKWREALPSGNGKLGAAVYGSVYEETVLLTHEELWRGSQTPELPDVSDNLPEVRRLMLGGDAPKANRILADALEERGYKPKMAWPLPLADLKVIMPSPHGFKAYQRELNMETGEVTVTWRDGETRYYRSLFVSRPDDVIVYEIRAEGPDKVQAEFRLELHDPKDIRKSATLPEKVEQKTDGQYLFYAAENDDRTDFGAVARVIPQGGTLESGVDRLHVSGADSVLVILQLFVKGERAAEWPLVQRALAEMKTSYLSLLQPHAEEHGRLFRAVSLDLGAGSHARSNEELLLDAYKGEASLEMTEKMWAYGRYLLISSSRDGGQPCHLYGLWCGEYEGMWAFNMSNENIQMIYWQALSGNTPELLLAMFDYFDRLLDDFRTNAKRLYGCRGIYIPAPTAPDTGLLKHKAPHIIHWTGAAGWIAQHYYDYYLYTGDLQFLRERALPFLRETALFYEDFFFEDEEGYYVSCPSNSPENFPGNYSQGPGKKPLTETAINSTMDFAIAKEVLTHLIEGAEEAGVYSEEIGKWKTMLGKIRPYRINEDGAVSEWMHPDFHDNYHHRHQSHIYPVFPGTEVSRDRDPELFEAFVIAAKKRLVIGLKEQTGWSLAHMSNHYARMGEGDLALECLDLLSRTCVINNFYTFHNDWRKMGIGVDADWAPFQIDANMGWSTAVQEMLLFSLNGTIRVLPALPSKWRKGHAGPLLARGAVEVSIAWDQDAGTVQLELCSRNRSQTVDLELPRPVADVQGLHVDGSRIRGVALEAGVPVRLVLNYVN